MKRSASSEVKLGLIQTDVSANPDANLKKTISLIERAAKSGAKIICTQELFRSQYFCQSEDHANFKLAEKIPGPSVRSATEPASPLRRDESGYFGGAPTSNRAAA